MFSNLILRDYDSSGIGLGGIYVVLAVLSIADRYK
jgi:hypothetical protein